MGAVVSSLAIRQLTAVAPPTFRASCLLAAGGSAGPGSSSPPCVVLGVLWGPGAPAAVSVGGGPPAALERLEVTAAGARYAFAGGVALHVWRRPGGDVAFRLTAPPLPASGGAGAPADDVRTVAPAIQRAWRPLRVAGSAEIDVLAHLMAGSAS